MVRLNASVHPSFSEVVTETLRRRNIITIVDFIAADPVKLTTSTGLSHTDILQMKQHIVTKFGSVERNAVELLVEERNNVIPTNITCLDELLKGGLNPRQLCELCGLSSSGKTQLCLTIAANVVATLSDIVTWYFDTKRDFSRLRFEEILKARKYKQEIVEQALQRIKICHVRSSRELIGALRQLLILCKTERNDTPHKDKRLLVVIDSLPAIIFQITRHAHQNGHETTYELNDLAEICRFLAKDCRATVITVNSTTCWNSPQQTNPAVIMPALGKYWTEVPATRLLLTRQQDETRKIAVWKDLRLKSGSYCTVTIGDAGIMPR